MTLPRAVRAALEECPAEAANVIRRFIDEMAEEVAAARTADELATLVDDSKDALTLATVALGSFQSQEAAIVERLDELAGYRSVAKRVGDHIDACLSGAGKVLGQFSPYHWIALVVLTAGVVTGSITHADLWRVVNNWFGADGG